MRVLRANLNDTLELISMFETLGATVTQVGDALSVTGLPSELDPLKAPTFNDRQINRMVRQHPHYLRQPKAAITLIAARLATTVEYVQAAMFRVERAGSKTPPFKRKLPRW